MTKQEMLDFIKEKMRITPYHFSEMTLHEARQFEEDFYTQERLKKTENRKKQVFEQLLKKKQRQLLVV